MIAPAYRDGSASSTPPSETPPAASGPLSYPVFRALWIATIASNVGTWMEDAGSGWLMTSLTSNPLMVALIQAATTLPIFLLAVPGGALADILDRRRLLIASQVLAVLAAGTLAATTWLNLTSPAVLLIAAATLGIAAAMSGPAFQAIVPELVGPAAVRQAVGLNSLGVNISRAVGPALGGVTIAVLGPAAVFAANAILTATVIGVLLRWRRHVDASTLPPEHFLGAVRAGLRFARGTPALRAVLIRAFAFFVFSSALLSLLPIIGRRTLALDAGHYGLLLGSMGAGAVLAAVALRRAAARLSPDRLSVGATVALSASMLLLAHVHALPEAMCAMAVAGGAWVTTLSSLNGAAQRTTPAWVRARSLSLYLVFFQGGMAMGAVLWGTLASHAGVGTAVTIAALGLLLTLPLARLFPMPGAADLEPSIGWPAPVIDELVQPDQGPVMITVEYTIDPDQRAAFLVAMTDLGRVRRRDGAFAWHVFEDAGRPGNMIETFLVESWLEHLRQHERLTHADVPLQAMARSFHTGGSDPEVRHLIAPKPTARARWL